MASVSIPETATYQEFAHAFTVALTRYGVSPYLGVWHDDEHHVIEFDPVDVVSTTAEVDALGAIYPVAGGAYHFATGNGYWPNGKSVQAESATYNDIPETRGTSRTRGTYDAGTGRDRDDAARLAAFQASQS